MKKKLQKQKKQTKKTKSKKFDDDDVDETIKKRMTLISKKEEIVGTNISSNEIKNMNKKRIYTLYELYEEKQLEDGFSDNFLQPFVEILVKGLSYLLIFDDELELKKDLMENKQLRKIIARYYFKLGNHQEKYLY